MDMTSENQLVDAVKDGHGRGPISREFGASYIHRTYKCQDSGEDTTLKGRVLGTNDQGLPPKEVRLGYGACRRILVAESESRTPSEFSAVFSCPQWKDGSRTGRKHAVWCACR